MPDDQIALGSIESPSVFVTFLCVRRPDPLLKNQLFPSPLRVGGVLTNRVLGIRKLLIVVEKVLSSHAGHPLGRPRHPKTPDRHVNVVHTVIPDVATAEGVPPTPDAMEQVRTVIKFGGRSQPHFIIEMFRRHGGLTSANRPSTLTVPCFGDKNIPQLSAMNPVDRLLDAICTSALSSHLENFARPLDCLRHRPSFGEVVTAWLLHVNMLPRIERHDGRRAMPVIWRRDEDRINLIVREDLSQITRFFGLNTCRLFDIVCGGIAPMGVHVTHGSNRDIVTGRQVSDVLHPHPAWPDDPDIDF